MKTDLWYLAGECVGAALCLAVLATAALSHEWYDPVCCNERDCRPIDSSQVQLTPDGWVVTFDGQKQLVPYGKQHPEKSPDGQYHICTMTPGGKPTLRTRPPMPPYSTDRRFCLHVPPQGV